MTQVLYSPRPGQSITISIPAKHDPFEVMVRANCAIFPDVDPNARSPRLEALQAKWLAEKKAKAGNGRAAK